MIRTVNPRLDPNADPTDTPYHEVIFLGQTGEGSASQLMSQADLAQKIESLKRINVMLVVDTTESMTPYLPLIQSGIARFISNYGQKSLDAANQLPDMRIAVYAYSDFTDANRTGLSDPIRIAQLMPPSRIGAGFNVTSALNRISQHEGLEDEVGVAGKVGFREEAALEAVLQLSRLFGSSKGWFEDGPRVIIHIADHGSRPNVRPEEILGELAKSQTKYFPIAVITDDKGESDRRDARRTFMRQATAMLSALLPNATNADVTTIQLQNLQNTTPETIKNHLDLVMGEVTTAISKVRGDVVGSDLVRQSQVTADTASLASRITLDEQLLADRGLQNLASQVIVLATTGFAPLNVRERGLTRSVDWTYTVSLEPAQARFLRQNFESMCQMVGSPEQRNAFRYLIVNLAKAFSGDEIQTNDEVRTVLADLRNLPGADRSFLAQSTETLLARADSTDPAVIEELRKDVCWTSYQLGNMDANIYATPDQVVWTGREFTLKPGEEVIKRFYRYKPVVGAEAVYLPSFFFVLPSIVATQEVGDEKCEFFCN